MSKVKKREVKKRMPESLLTYIDMELHNLKLSVLLRVKLPTNPLLPT